MRVPALIYILVSIVLATLAPWRPEPTSTQRAGAEPQPCQPPKQLKRTFVGLPDGEQPLSDFEHAATQAKQILKAAKEQSCRLDERGDAGGRLRAALGAAPVEITSVSFKARDLTVAEVRLERAEAKERSRPSRRRASTWMLRAVRDGAQGWKIVSSDEQ